MKKTFLLLALGSLGTLLSTPVSATSRYLNTDGTPNYNQLTSQANNNQLNADMRNALMQGLWGHNRKLISALNAIKTELEAIKGLITSPTPAIINGKCWKSLRSCESGTAVVVAMTEECGYKKIWNCNGLYGGNNVSCKVDNPVCPPLSPQLVTLKPHAATSIKIISSIWVRHTCPVSTYKRIYSTAILDWVNGEAHVCMEKLPSWRRANVGSKCIDSLLLSTYHANSATHFYIIYEEWTIDYDWHCSQTRTKEKLVRAGQEYTITP